MDKKIIYDVGLHIGEDTEYYLARGHRVIAIEANPDLVSYCQNKFKAFVNSGDLVIIHGAVVEDDSQAFVKFYKNKKSSIWGTVVKSWADRNSMLGAESIEITVPVVNFYELISSYGCPYYLKIDIEGMDLVCLKKLFLTDCRPNFLSIESEKIDFSALIEEFDVLQSLGYKKFYVQQQADMTSNSVPLSSKEGVYVDYKFSRGSTGLFGSDLGNGWVPGDAALKKYEHIFREYQRYGDNSLLRKMPFGKYFLFVLGKIIGRPLPGWYDTHASLD